MGTRLSECEYGLPQKEIVWITIVSFVTLVSSANIAEVNKVDGILRATCSVDYSPCYCYKYDETGELKIGCEGVPLETVQEVFANSSAIAPGTKIKEFELKLFENETEAIPSNLLGDSEVGSLYIACPNPENFFLNIHHNAFRSSENSMNKLTMYNCDAQELEWAFISGFDNIQDLIFMFIRNLGSFRTLPTFSASLKTLTINAGTGLINLPAIKSYLLHLDLSGNDITDQGAARIMRTIAASVESRYSLQSIRWDDNMLSSVPDKLEKLENLTNVHIQQNQITTLRKGDMRFTSEPTYISLTDNSINVIEAGAFQGNYGNAIVTLYHNNIEKFEELVFKRMLQDMLETGIGSLSIVGNPLVCDCGIAWLIRKNRHLLDAINSAECANSTRFQDLNPDAFADCDSTPTSSTTLTTTIATSTYQSTTPESSTATSTPLPVTDFSLKMLADPCITVFMLSVRLILLKLTE